MSNALSYCARRRAPLTLEEAQAIDIVIARYQSDFEYGEEGDAFDPDPADPAQPETLLSGRIRLPDDPDAHAYWVDCMTDIRRVLEDAEWIVRLDGDPLAWDDDDGWLIDLAE